MRFVRWAAPAAALILAAAAAWAQGPRPFGGPGGGSPLMLLRIPEVQQELKVDDAQRDLLMQLGQEMMGRMREAFQNFQSLSPEERRKQFEALNAEVEKKVAEILDAKQVARLKELQLQQAGLRALDRKDVAEKLKLTPEQREKIAAALREEGDAQRAAFQGFDFQNATPEQRQQMFQKMREVRQATDAKLGTVLSEPQKKQLESLKGTPFKFPERRPNFAGGF